MGWRMAMWVITWVTCTNDKLWNEGLDQEGGLMSARLTLNPSLSAMDLDLSMMRYVIFYLLAYVINSDWSRLMDRLRTGSWGIWELCDMHIFACGRMHWSGRRKAPETIESSNGNRNINSDLWKIKLFQPIEPANCPIECVNGMRTHRVPAERRIGMHAGHSSRSPQWINII